MNAKIVIEFLNSMCDWNLTDYFYDINQELGEGSSSFLNNESFEKALLGDDKKHNEKVISVLDAMKDSSWSEYLFLQFSDFVIDNNYDPEIFDRDPFTVDSIIKFINV